MIQDFEQCEVRSILDMCPWITKLWLLRNYIPNLYDRERERICSELSHVGYYALTTDILTSRHNEAYTGILLMPLIN